MLIATISYIGTGETKGKDNEVIVHKGSLMKREPIITKKWTDCNWIERSRRDLLNKGVLQEYDQNYYELQTDEVFSSPNRAACIFLGYITTKAWDEIVNSKGKSLREVYK